MMPALQQVATAVGRPPVATGVSAPSAAPAPRLAAPAVNTGPVGRPPSPAGAAGGGFMGKMMGAARSFRQKLGGGAPAMKDPSRATPQGAAGAMGGWNADPGLVQNAVKMLKAGAELGPQHRAPLAQILQGTDKPQPGPFQKPAGAGAGQRTFASRFRGPEVA
jgi:hypothetical protein